MVAVALLVLTSATLAGPPGTIPARDVAVSVDPLAPPQERFAAEQLARYLGLAAGRVVPILAPADAERQRRRHVAVGAAAALRNGVPLELLKSEPKLGLDGMLCRSRGLPAKPGGAMLVLTGGALPPCVSSENCSAAQPRGAINAVFEYLRMAGTRVLALNATISTPITDTLPACDLLWTPSYDFRMLNQYSTTDNRWDGGAATATPTSSPSEGFEGSGTEFWVANHLSTLTTYPSAFCTKVG